jgi:hypothetical protein
MQTDVRGSIFFSFSSNVQLLFCQYHTYTHTHICVRERRVEEYERLTAVFDVFFFFFFVIRPFIHIDMSRSSRRLDKEVNTCICSFSLALSLSFFFVISRSFSNMIEWTIMSNYDKWMREKGIITLLRKRGDVFWNVQRRERERKREEEEEKSKNKIFFVHVIHIFSRVKSNCRLMHLNIVACVCVIRGLRHDYRPIYIWDREKWKEVAWHGLYIHSRRKRKLISMKSKTIQCQIEMNERKRQKATCGFIQIYMSIGDNGNECVCLIQSTYWTSGFFLLTNIYITIW